VVGKEAALDAVYAQVKAVAAGSRSDGVGPGLGLAAAIDGYGREKLAWRVVEILHLIELKLQVKALGGF